jgi:HEPN domain-containing protein
MKPLDFAEVLLTKAEEDLLTLQVVVGEKTVVDRNVGLHAEQAVEKALKAVLTAAGIRAKGTKHSIDMLIELLAERFEVPDWLDEARSLSPFAGVIRYAEVPLDQPLNREATVPLVQRTLEWCKERIAELGEHE